MNSPINVYYLMQLSLRMKEAPLQTGVTILSEEIQYSTVALRSLLSSGTIIFCLLWSWVSVNERTRALAGRAALAVTHLNGHSRSLVMHFHKVGKLTNADQKREVKIKAVPNTKQQNSVFVIADLVVCSLQKILTLQNRLTFLWSKCRRLCRLNVNLQHVDFGHLLWTTISLTWTSRTTKTTKTTSP